MVRLKAVEMMLGKYDASQPHPVIHVDIPRHDSALQQQGHDGEDINPDNNYATARDGATACEYTFPQQNGIKTQG
eukprot:CAMPEP_0172486720 /NCGR_PEP_ID=MMETSP1066-20121228/15409_1 /TAXON_ID=671091 /ORGANISM="Coscinodiscus wailesii, Strain CCMP2513" /LENGTH=74 /DNA_ID=CAMNT_0013252845 /DNA_START=377 /DNA_END=602 /DNA_ORIENTATION=+